MLIYSNHYLVVTKLGLDNCPDFNTYTTIGRWYRNLRWASNFTEIDTCEMESVEDDYLTMMRYEYEHDNLIRLEIENEDSKYKLQFDNLTEENILQYPNLDFFENVDIVKFENNTYINDHFHYSEEIDAFIPIWLVYPIARFNSSKKGKRERRRLQRHVYKYIKGLIFKRVRKNPLTSLTDFEDKLTYTPDEDFFKQLNVFPKKNYVYNIDESIYDIDDYESDNIYYYEPDGMINHIIPMDEFLGEDEAEYYHYYLFIHSLVRDTYYKKLYNNLVFRTPIVHGEYIDYKRGDKI